MKQKYINHTFQRATQERLETVTNILDDYTQQGYRLSLRQLYYQLVSRDVIANTDREYKRLGGMLTKARLGGMVDWDSIEDRVRKMQIPYWVMGVEDAIKDTISHYRLDRQIGQKNYIEVWLEKDALSEVLGRVTQEYHIPLMVNRGYSSISMMRVAAQRFIRRARYKSQNLHILYFGDHDPSGLDMVRDIRDRLSVLEVRGLTVHHIALTRQQIAQYNPPPNPAKLSDSRAADYIAEHGYQSWELDALEPSVLDSLLRDSIEKLIDRSLFDGMITLEKKHKDTLKDFSDNFNNDNDEEE